MLAEITLKTQTPPNWFWQLRPLGRHLFQLPLLSALRPLASRAAAVSTPAGRISFQDSPTLASAGNGRQLTLLSANLYHDWPRYRRLHARLETVAQLIEAEAADIVLLQEVSRTRAFRSDEWLAQRLGMAYVYARANGHESAIGFEEGLAIFSRFPLAAPVLTELGGSSNPFSRRLGLGVEVVTPSENVPVFSVHLALTAGRNAAQVSQLQSWIGGIAGGRMALIGGDFNAHESAGRMKRLRENWVDTFRRLHPHKDGTTHELRWPWGRTRRRRLDYHFLRCEQGCWQVQEARHLESGGSRHSDHSAVLTRLRNDCSD